MRDRASWFAVLSLLSYPGLALAQEGSSMADPMTTPPDAMAAEPAREEGGSPYERPGQAYYFVGARTRLLLVPIWLQELFVTVGGLPENASGVNFGFGGEFTYRKDNFDIVVAAWYAGFRNGPTIYRGKDETAQSNEWVENSLSAIFVTLEVLWSAPLNDMIAFVYGAGIGVGLVMGELRRWEAYPTGTTWARCDGVGIPDAGYCEAGGQYNVRDTNVPPVIPWLALPQIGFRFKPHRNFMFRIDGGFGLGFFLEAAASIGF